MASEKNPYFISEKDLKHDFGFTFENEDDIVAKAISPVSDEVIDLKKRLEAIRKIYLPLLENLSKNSDQPIIRWPDRGPVLKSQIEKLISLTEPGFGGGP